MLLIGALPTFPSALARADAVEVSPFEIDFPDPFVLNDDGAYYAFATGARGRHVQVARSTNLTSWTMLPDALPKLPSWAIKERGFTWAPSVLRRDRQYVLYYTAADSGSGFQCISRAVATRPEGPYVDDSPRPFVCQADSVSPFCGSIDPSPFLDTDGRVFLLYKSDENALKCGSRPRIWSQLLSDDGLSVAGPPTPLLAADRSWEGPIIEGPSMMRDASNKLFLFYSANWYESPEYAVGYARCDGPMGPCQKVTIEGPFVKSTESFFGPGGQEIFTDTLGQPWVAYHAWTRPTASYSAGDVRALRLGRLRILEGMPALTH
ncbi:MAG TPA: glycoside hydrolase family 43 protein [Labilithrix sp.]|nr:glycoside hydrolase family 43 protein [Labilithrix sp.]